MRYMIIVKSRPELENVEQPPEAFEEMGKYNQSLVDAGILLAAEGLTGTKDGAAPASANGGTLVPDGSLTNATLEPGRVGARCKKGFLLIGGDVPNLGPYVLPGNNYHVYDYVLFWQAIRNDAERRIDAWHR